MKPAPFDYHRPQSLDAALALWAAADGEGVYLAGGQSLLPAMAMRLNTPAALIDLNHVPDLAGVNVTDTHVRIGAMTRYADLIADPAITLHLPLLAKALTHVAHPAIRNRGTIGGSLALSDPAAEMPAVALVHDAVLTVTGPDGVRDVAATDWLLGMYETALEPGEILTSITFPVAAPHRPWAFSEIARRQGDYALAGLAVMGGDDPRVVWFGIADHAIRDTSAEAGLTAAAPRAAIVAGALQGIAVSGDTVTGTATRAHLARVLLDRVLRDWGKA